MKTNQFYTGKEIRMEFPSDITHLEDNGEWDSDFDNTEFVMTRNTENDITWLADGGTEYAKGGIWEFVSANGWWVLSIYGQSEPYMDEMDAREYLKNDGFNEEWIRITFP